MASCQIFVIPWLIALVSYVRSKFLFYIIITALRKRENDYTKERNGSFRWKIQSKGGGGKKIAKFLKISILPCPFEFRANTFQSRKLPLPFRFLALDMCNFIFLLNDEKYFTFCFLSLENFPRESKFFLRLIEGSTATLLE